VVIQQLAIIPLILLLTPKSIEGFEELHDTNQIIRGFEPHDL
jgi:hypothetical protein